MSDRLAMSREIRGRLRAIIDLGNTRAVSRILADMRAKGLHFCPDCHLWHLTPCECGGKTKIAKEGRHGLATD